MWDTRQQGSTPFLFRPFLRGFPPFKGVIQNGAPNISHEHLRNAINVRFTGDSIRERGGQSKATSGGALTGTVYGIFDDLEG